MASSRSRNSPQQHLVQSLTHFRLRTNFQDHHNSCIICCEQFEKGCIITQLPCSCKRFFHSHCLMQWLISHSTCPICRCEIGSTNQESNVGSSSSCPVQHDETTRSSSIEERTYQTLYGGSVNTSTTITNEQPQSSSYQELQQHDDLYSSCGRSTSNTVRAYAMLRKLRQTQARQSHFQGQKHIPTGMEGGVTMDDNDDEASTIIPPRCWKGSSSEDDSFWGHLLTEEV